MMKKLFAILIAMMMVFSLVACDTGDNPNNPSSGNNPGSSQSGGDNQGGDNTTSGKEWPTNLITAWSGSGKIIYLKDNSDSGGAYKNYWVVYIDTATMDEFTDYIAELKSAGFAYGQIDGEVEPSDGYDEFEYNYAWNGHTSDGREINVKRYHEPNEGVDSDFNTFDYSVQISLWIRADATINQGGDSTNNNENSINNGDGTQSGVYQNGDYTFEGCKAYLSNDMGFVGFNFPDDLNVVEFEYGDGAAKVTYCPVDSRRYEEIVQALFAGTAYTVTDSAGKSVSQSSDVLDITLDERLYTHGFHLVKDDGDHYLVVIEYWPTGYQFFDVSYDTESLCIYIYG